MNASPIAGTAAAGEIGQRLERFVCPAIVIDERTECARPDILAADQAQPVEPLLVGQANTAAALALDHIAPRLGTSSRSIAQATAGHNRQYARGQPQQPKSGV